MRAQLSPLSIVQALSNHCCLSVTDSAPSFQSPSLDGVPSLPRAYPTEEPVPPLAHEVTWIKRVPRSCCGRGR